MVEGRRENVQRKKDGDLKGRTGVEWMKIRSYRMVPPKKPEERVWVVRMLGDGSEAGLEAVESLG